MDLPLQIALVLTFLSPLLAIAAEDAYERLAGSRRRLVLAALGVLVSGSAAGAFTDWSLVGVVPDVLAIAAAGIGLLALVWRVHRVRSRVIRCTVLVISLLVLAAAWAIACLLIVMAWPDNGLARTERIEWTLACEIRGFGSAISRSRVVVNMAVIPRWCPVIERHFARVDIEKDDVFARDVTVALTERAGARVAEVRLREVVCEAVPLP